MSNVFRHIGNRKPTVDQLVNFIKSANRGTELEKFKAYRAAIKDGRATVAQVIKQMKMDKLRTLH